jgi:hypothetical protein
MILHTLIPFVGFLVGFSSAATSGLNSTRMGPIDLTKVDNSTEHEFDLGTTPIAPYGVKQTSEEWATPLVNGCPRLCAGPDGSKWTHIHNVKDLEGCEAPLLFDMNVHTETVETICVCALGSLSLSNPSKAAEHLQQYKRYRAERRETKQTEIDSKSSPSKYNPTPILPIPVIITFGMLGVLNATGDITIAL